MKYKEKLQNFIEDLNQNIPYLGVMCCGKCGRHAYEESGYEKSFFILSDDLDNKASQGVDLLTQNISESDFDFICNTAAKNKLSFYFSVFTEKNTFRMGVYSKKGKQEIKTYLDGKDYEKIREEKYLNSL
jgi:hypothetical protein